MLSGDGRLTSQLHSILQNRPLGMRAICSAEWNGARLERGVHAAATRVRVPVYCIFYTFPQTIQHPKMLKLPMFFVWISG